MQRSLLILGIFCLSFSLSAKEAIIKWGKVEFATKYHLQVFLKDDTIVDKKLSSKAKNWTGQLEPGLYHYRIRVYDKVGRPSDWSKPHPLIVKPDPPKPKVEDKAEVFAGEEGIELSWEAIPNVKQYKITIIENGSKVLTKTVEGTSAKIPGLKDGNYMWQVQGVLSAGDRAPASLSGVTAGGGMSAPQSITVHTFRPRPDVRARFYTSSGIFDYSLVRSNGARAEVGALSLRMGVDAEYWFNDNWAALVDVTSTFIRLTDNSATVGSQLFEGYLGAGYAALRPTGTQKWEIIAHAGVRARQHLIIDINNITNSTINNAGPAVGAQIRHHVSDRFSLGGNVEWFLPVADLGFESTGSTKFTNLTMNLDASYLLMKNLTLSGGLLFQMKDVSFLEAGANTNSTISHQLIHGVAMAAYNF